MYGDIPTILQGAAQRETLTPEQLARLQAEGTPVETTHVNFAGMLPVIIIGAVAAWFLGGGTRRRSLFILLPLALLGSCAISSCRSTNERPKVDTATVDTTRAAETARAGNNQVLALVPSGVDTIVNGDTTRYVYWHTVVDSTRTVVKPPPPVAGTKPFGGYGQMSMDGAPPFTPFNGASDAVSNQKWLTDALVKARDGNMRNIIAMPCGSHNTTRLGNCLRDSSGTAVFSWRRFDSTLASFNTPTNKAAVAKAYADGVILGINSMDEPWVRGGGDGNTWGPNGLTRAQADTVCKKVKAVFPNIPVGLSDITNTGIWPITSYGGFRICDFGLFQYSYRFGAVTSWANTAVAQATKYGYMAMFSFNPINGGTQDPKWICAQSSQGQRKPNCMMTPTQIVDVVRAVGDRGCGVQLFWRWDDIRFKTAGYTTAFSQSAQIQKNRNARPCKRR